jgi:hypothetical protein
LMTKKGTPLSLLLLSFNFLFEQRSVTLFARSTDAKLELFVSSLL